jgi:hypothetical protein
MHLRQQKHFSNHMHAPAKIITPTHSRSSNNNNHFGLCAIRRRLQMQHFTLLTASPGYSDPHSSAALLHADWFCIVLCKALLGIQRLNVYAL